EPVGFRLFGFRPRVTVGTVSLVCHWESTGDSTVQSEYSFLTIVLQGFGNAALLECFFQDYSEGWVLSRAWISCLRSEGSTRPAGNGHANRSTAASCAADPLARGSLHSATKRPIAFPRRISLATSTRASSSERAASARSSVQSVTQSTSIRASMSPRS